MRALGADLHVDRRGHRHGRAASVLRRRGRRRDPRAASSPTSARATRWSSEPRQPSRPARRPAAGEPLLSSDAPKSRAVVRAVRPARRLAHRPAARASTPPCCGCDRRCAGSRSRSTDRRLGERDPFRGRRAGGARAARNVACAGGEPLALTDCLNFGNPEKPEIGWELARRSRASPRPPRRSASRSSPATFALQRDRRPRDPAHAGRRLRRARSRRPRPGAGPATRCSREAATSSARVQRLRLARRARPRPGAEAALVRFLWRGRARAARSRTTSSDGGLAVALAEAAAAESERVLGARRGRPPIFPEPGRRSATHRSSRARPGQTSATDLGLAHGPRQTHRDGARYDVRRLRHPRARARRRAPDLLRPARAPAPRPGVGRDRRLRRRAG